jgi:hypothetical protein
MTRAVKFFLLSSVLIFATVLRLNAPVQAMPVSFPERLSKPDNPVSLAATDSQEKCLKGYRLIRGNCRKFYGGR